MPENAIRKKILNLLDSQLLAALSTQRQGQPYVNLIAFAHADNLATLVFATPRPTRKFANLMANPRVSLMVDSRSNSEADFHEASAVTILGEVREIGKDDLAHYKSLYLKRHPSLENFVNSPTTSFLKVSVKHYILVNRFQHVMELHLTDEVDIFSR
jgi:nitroimidazol reductase NimA-like FMN-containing flavoprotein (pyridoxamine 5'-phosphate oxidase superfamily)